MAKEKSAKSFFSSLCNNVWVLRYEEDFKKKAFFKYGRKCTRGHTYHTCTIFYWYAFWETLLKSQYNALYETFRSLKNYVPCNIE